jgi:hypothetical protein
LSQKGKTIAEKEPEKDTNMEDSDDSGPYFDGHLSPGGQHFTFGDFQNMEIQNILKMQLNERTVAINEYGTNMLKYKYDPLAVIEAKVAMYQGKGGMVTRKICRLKVALQALERRRTLVRWKWWFKHPNPALAR